MISNLVFLNEKSLILTSKKNKTEKKFDICNLQFDIPFDIVQKQKQTYQNR